MDSNKNRNKESKTTEGSETKKQQKSRGSAFNEKSVGRQDETIFSETNSVKDLGEEKDILSGVDQKSKPQPDAEV